MRNWRVGVSGILVLLCVPASDAQILNTLRGFESDAAGWSGEIAAFLSASGGNTENRALTGAGSVQWQGEVHRWRLIADGSRATSHDETTEEASAVHLRHNARLASRFSSLAFVQHQHDRFQRLRSRFLFGAGLRWDCLRRGKLDGAVGVSLMLELEELEGDDIDSNGRLSTFVSLLGHVDERVRVDLTAFLQPRLTAFDDVRAVASSSLRVELSGALSLALSFRLQYDSKPAPGTDDVDWRSKTGVSVTL